ncbi:MAG: DUF86 domain-containing protein [Verrucomicrobiae bacterium]|nr:DUF86 domain-containing protein [Verrucomicrobiae bacterium]
MSRHDPKVTLRQIRDCARRAQELCAQNELAAILSDWQKRLAFERVMEVLGEGVKRLPPELCARYPSVPWRLIAGMRDRISHGYDAIDYATLWDTVRDDVPGLLMTVEQMLQDLEKPSSP